MTPKQAKRVIRSLQYRQELVTTVPTLRAELMALVQASGPCIIGGYRMWIHEDQLIIKEIPVVPINQLPLPLEFLDDGEALAEAEITLTELCLNEGLNLV